MRILVFALFILSGAAGLIYEVVWARQLVLVFGNTTQATSAILTGFFGGMAIGSLLGGRVADRVGRPLRLYGILEVVLVAVVLATPVTFRLLHELYRGVYPTVVEMPGVRGLLRFALALLALAPATVLMGATLPTLTRFLTRSGEHMSRSFGRLYAANIIGAIVGTATAGFVLIEVLGLSGALLVGAACSGLAGLTAIALDTRSGVVAPSEPPSVVTDRPIGATGRSSARLALIVAFASGVTSLGYQVLWTRLVSSGTGGSTYVFTTILTLFLLGLAIGALVFAWARTRVRSVVSVLAFTQAAVGAFALVGSALVFARPSIGLLSSLDDPLGALVGFMGSAAIVVLPATICLGIALPASSALMPDDRTRVGTEAGLLLTVNTAGTIVATFLIPFAFIPAIGSPATLGLLAVVNGLVAVLLALDGRTMEVGQRRGTGVMGGLVAGAAILALVSGTVFVNPSVVRIEDQGGQVAAAAEDEIASVEAGQIDGVRQLWVNGSSMTLLTVDAKLMPLLPLMLRPESERMLIVAFGMGSSYRTALLAGLEVDAVELVPSVPGTFGYFHPDAETVFANERGRRIIADGRNHVELTDRTYDLVMVDPPPPIETSGVSVISSLEFYEATKERLTPGGVMMQWVPYNQTLEEFLAHVRSFRAAFPHVRVNIGPGGYGFFMLGSDEPVEFDRDAMRAILERPGILEDLASAPDGASSPPEEWIERIEYLTWVDESQIDEVLPPGPLITDDRPLPEYFLLRRLANPHAEELRLAGLDRLKRESLAAD